MEGGHIRLVQQWEVQGNGVAIAKDIVKVFAGKTYHLSPRCWKRLYLAFKLEVDQGGVVIASALSRDGLVSGVSLTSGGMLRLDVYNSTSKVVRVAPITQLVSIRGHSKVEIKRLQSPKMDVSALDSSIGEIANSLKEEVMAKWPEVGDLSRHPITPAMEKLKVRASEVHWQTPTDFGCRTPYRVESVACRKTVQRQIAQYIKRGYLRRVSCSEDVFLSPLLPIKKKDGSYRLTTDFRSLNAHFSKKGQAQVDVWRKLWQLDPQWRYYAQIDLKDAFLSVPIVKELQRLFAFSWGEDRYCWLRIPQGWTWGSVLFGERVTEAVQGIPGVINFADDLLLAASDPATLRCRIFEVFDRLSLYGFKVNLEKTNLCANEIKFLGLEIGNGQWSLKGYLKEKFAQFGDINTWKSLERLVGVISYARRTIIGVEPMLAEIRECLKEAKMNKRSEEWWNEVAGKAKCLMAMALDKQQFLSLPGLETTAYILETDWSNGYGGYMLYALSQGRLLLCDIGSKRIPEMSSSFLGELRALTWACKSTKAYRGDIDLIIRTDNHAVATALGKEGGVSEDKRVFRLRAWIISNEMYEVEYLPGLANRGADLLSRPPKGKESSKKKPLMINSITDEQRERISQAHAGHFDWVRTYENLKRQGKDVWKGARGHVKQYVKECKKCNDYASLPRSPSYKAWDVPHPNHSLFLDFCGPWSWGVGGEALNALVLCDGFSRFAMTRIASGPKTKVILDALSKWVNSYGVPKRIISDQGPAFVGCDLSRFCKNKGISHYFVGIRAHFSNGICERCIGTLLNRLRKIGNIGPWKVILSRAVSSYNSTWHSALGCSPQEIFLGIDSSGDWISTEKWLELVTEVDERNRKKASKLRSKSAPNENDYKFHLGDSVRFHSPSSSKLRSPWIGPATLCERIGSRLWMVEYRGKTIGPLHSWHIIHSR